MMSRRQNSLCATLWCIFFLFTSPGMGAASEKYIHFMCPEEIKQGKQEQTAHAARVPVTAIATEILSMITKRLGYALEITRVPEKRALLLLETGQADAFAFHQVSKTGQTDHIYLASRQKKLSATGYFLWSDPLFEINELLISLAALPVEYSSPEALIGLSIGTVAGAKSPVLDDGFRIGAVNQVQVPDAFSLLELLQKKQVDAVLLNGHVALSLIEKNPQFSRAAFYFSPKPVEVFSYRLLFARQDRLQTFLMAFNSQLKKMKQDKTLEPVLKKHLLLPTAQ